MKTANIFTPVVTAFDKNGNLDVQANKNIYDHLINGGVDGLVIMGSSGEFFSMTSEQKKELINLVTEYCANRTRLLIGTSCMRPDDTIELSNYALSKGAEAVMIIGPYYFALSDESIESYFDEVAAGINGNIYIYNFPARTGYDVNADVTLSLVRKHKNIVGFKDTVTEMGHTRKLITTVCSEFPQFVVFSGFDENLVHNVISGGDGCIGGLSNLYPEIFSKLVKAINEKDIVTIEECQKIIDKMMDIYDIGVPFMPVMKKAMMLRGIEISDYSTKPFLQVTDKQIEKIKAVMKSVNLI